MASESSGAKSTYGGEIHEPEPPESEWVVSVKEKLEQGRQDNVPGSWSELSIYRFPHYLKDDDDKAWVPQIVSLGPYHHGQDHLRHMERHKWRCLHRILERSNQKIDLYLDSVKEVEGRARACYEGTISMSRDEFVEMMVLDGCFVIELFQGFAKGFEELGYPGNDPVFSMRRSILEIRRDMIMLENQIPLFMLDQLLGLQLGDPNQKGRVAKLAIRFFNPLMPGVKGAIRELDHNTVHCLDVFRRWLLHLDQERGKPKDWSHARRRYTFCLSKLREAGIKIKSTDAKSSCDIQFEEGILLIPRIVIHEGTRSLFLNLIAFEQSHFDCETHITSYVIFMHNLINSPEDAQYLCEREIIKHCLGSDAEVADLFNRLCQEVALDREFSSYLLPLSIRLTVYRISQEVSFRAALAQKWNSWRVILKNKYFDNPWSIISFIAASVLLVLTFIQAFYAVYGYYRPLRS